MAETPALPPAGWYADPDLPGQQRYWDGARWTDYRHNPGLGPQTVVYAPASKTNGFAVASLVLGILWLWWLGSVLALVFGYVGKSQIDRSGGRETGRGMAIAGIVLGWIGVAVLILIVVLAVVGVFENYESLYFESSSNFD